MRARNLVVCKSCWDCSESKKFSIDDDVVLVGCVSQMSRLQHCNAFFQISMFSIIVVSICFAFDLSQCSSDHIQCSLAIKTFLALIIKLYVLCLAQFVGFFGLGFGVIKNMFMHAVFLASSVLSFSLTKDMSVQIGNQVLVDSAS